MVIAFGFVVLAGLLVWRLAMLQVVEPEEYVEWGRGQRFDTIELQGSRGDIVDRNGEQLAVSLPQRSFFADPAYVTDPSAAADVLAPLLGLEVLDVYDRLTASSNFSWLARQVTTRSTRSKSPVSTRWKSPRDSTRPGRPSAPA